MKNCCLTCTGQLLPARRRICPLKVIWLCKKRYRNKILPVVKKRCRNCRKNQRVTRKIKKAKSDVPHPWEHLKQHEEVMLLVAKDPLRRIHVTKQPCQEGSLRGKGKNRKARAVLGNRPIPRHLAESPVDFKQCQNQRKNLLATIQTALAGNRRGKQIGADSLRFWDTIYILIVFVSCAKLCLINCNV